MRFSLAWQIVVGLVAGLLVGIFFPALGLRVKFISDIFLRLVQMIIVPLLLAVLVSGLSAGGGFKRVGRIALIGLLYFIFFTAVVFVLGAALGIGLQPGAMKAPAGGASVQELARAPQISFSDLVTNIFPSSAVDAMARNDILQLIIFALFLGVAISRAGVHGENLQRLFSELSRVMFLVTDFVMRLAPFGVFAALAYALAKEGFQVLFTLIRLVLVVYLGLLILVFGVFLMLALFFRIPFWAFLRALVTPFFLAFSTSSTMPALPRALENMEKFGVPKEVVSFILPLGLRFNALGSSLFQVIAIFFLIQYYGSPLGVREILMLLLVLAVTTKGLAPVPRASLVVLVATLTPFNLPLEGVGLILAVDQFMDMPRTGVNLLGNCLTSALVARATGTPASRFAPLS